MNPIIIILFLPLVIQHTQAMTGMTYVMILDLEMDRTIHLVNQHGIIVEMKKAEMMHTIKDLSKDACL